MRIALITDAWEPQVNGVVRTLRMTLAELVRCGHDVTVIGPDQFPGLPCPGEPSIRLALLPRRRLARLLTGFRPDAVHIATEGPLGWAARAECRARGWAFTTSFHTKFAEYVAARYRLPLSLGYHFLRRFHAPSSRVMAATPSLEATLRRHGFGPLGRWTRGVDLDLFRPDLPPPPDLPDLPRPIFAYVGRLAAEKNIDDFLSADLPGSKLLVGDGPDRAALTARWPQAHFTGPRSGADLAAHYAAADVLVFPSRTDTFGLVMLEALACGTPVAAYPVTGPLDIFSGSAGRKGGVLSDTLAIAARRALALNPADCRRLAENFSWAAATRQFLSQLTPIDAEHTRSVGTALAERLYS